MLCAVNPTVLTLSQRDGTAQRCFVVDQLEEAKSVPRDLHEEYVKYAAAGMYFGQLLAACDATIHSPTTTGGTDTVRQVATHQADADLASRQYRLWHASCCA